MNKLLHAPLVVLKQAASVPGEGDATIAVARRLFNLDKELKRPGHVRAAGVEDSIVPMQGTGAKSPCR